MRSLTERARERESNLLHGSCAATPGDYETSLFVSAIRGIGRLRRRRRRAPGTRDAKVKMPQGRVGGKQAARGAPRSPSRDRCRGLLRRDRAVTRRARARRPGRLPAPRWSHRRLIGGLLGTAQSTSLRGKAPETSGARVQAVTVSHANSGPEDRSALREGKFKAASAGTARD
jgi:hypothetical protein